MKETSTKAEPKQLLEEWFSHSEDLLNLTSKFSGCEIRAPDTPHDKEVAKVIAFKFTQAIRTFQSVLKLAEIGDATNSFMLMRNLFESLVDIAYLIANPKDVWRYLEDAAELEQKLRSAQIRHGPPPEENIGRKRPSPETLRKMFANYAEREASCKSWRRLSLKVRADKTGFPDISAMYEIIYPTASAYVHGASGILLDYLRAASGSSTEFHVEYERVDTETEPSVGLSAMIFLRLLAFLDALFDVGLRSRIETLHATQQELFRRSYGEQVSKYSASGSQAVE